MSSENSLGREAADPAPLRRWAAPPFRIRSLVQAAHFGAVMLVLLTAGGVSVSMTWGRVQEATQRRSVTAAVGQRLWRHVLRDWAEDAGKAITGAVDDAAVATAIARHDLADLQQRLAPALAAARTAGVRDGGVFDLDGAPLGVPAPAIADCAGTVSAAIAQDRSAAGSRLIERSDGALLLLPLTDGAHASVAWLCLRADGKHLAETLTGMVGLPLALSDADGTIVGAAGDRAALSSVPTVAESTVEPDGLQRVALHGGGALWIADGPLSTAALTTRQALAVAAACLLAVLLAALGVTWFCRRLRRLGALRDSMLRTLSSQRFGEILPVEGYDEVAELATVFNALSREMWADLEKRERMQAELRRAEERHRRILDSALDGTVLLDADGIIRWWSKPAERIFGWPAEEANGQHLATLLRDQDGEEEVRAWLDEARQISEGSLYAFGVSHRSGRKLLIEAAGAHLTLEDGERFCVFFRDVTDRRELEMRLAQSQKLETVGQLAAGIAHEINTPTQYVTDNTVFLKTSFEDIGAFVDTVRSAMADVPPETAERIETAATQADIDYVLVEAPKAIEQSLEGLDRVAKIVRSMKEFSHPTRGELEIVDVNRAVEATCTVARNEWKYVAELDLDLDPQRPMVCCLPGELNQAVLNLIVNAAHAIGDREQEDGKGKIRVSTRAGTRELSISVTDTGTGIPADIQSRIFDPFFTTKEVGRGTGQGLAIVYDVVVNKHGGRIDLESELGVGTTFTLSIPLGQGAPSSDRMAVACGAEPLPNS